MRCITFSLALLFGIAPAANAHGLLIPDDKSLPPLAMVSHRVDTTIEDQAAVTRVEQTFRNHTNRPLEATYLFAVPRGATVGEFAMWVGGKRVKGELVEAAKAKQTYEDIVRRIKDPGLLEYAGCDLLRMRVFPIPAHGDQKIEVRYTHLAPKDAGLVEYTYPIKTDGKATRTLGDFSLKLTLKSQHPIFSVYSPTHLISVSRPSDREAIVGFEKEQALLDKDFQLFYSVGGKEVGITALAHRPYTTEDGYVLLLVSPRAEFAETDRVPRDLVFVLDTSGSMAENGRFEQARRALKHCLARLGSGDRFALLTFATTVNRFADGVTEATSDQIAKANRWLDKLEASGGTAMDDALQAALDLQRADSGRTFTIAFFTDGKPTLGVTDPEKILANVARKNTARTRIFTFGVGHGVNASLLDRLAEQTRGASTYVLPSENLEAKVSAFYDKISRPVLIDLTLTAGHGIRLSEMYPPKLPDLFHGGQLVVLARYEGSGDAALKLTGRVGKVEREYIYEARFPSQSEKKPFVEELWARRKIGYLLDQIRVNGESKELVDAVTGLAKKYGIATPYTSWLVVPDTPVPIVRPPHPPLPPRPPWPRPVPHLLAPTSPDGSPRKLAEVAREVQQRKEDFASNRAKFEDARFAKLPSSANGDKALGAMIMAREQKEANVAALRALQSGSLAKVQVDRLGVQLSVFGNQLKNQNQIQPTALRQAAGRNLQEIGGIWIDDGFSAKAPIVTIRAMSNAYFRLLEKQPKLREAFQLSNHLVWMTPSGTALVIDEADGKDDLSDAEIDALFRVR